MDCHGPLQPGLSVLHHSYVLDSRLLSAELKYTNSHAQTYVMSADLFGAEDRTGDCEGYFPRGAIPADRQLHRDGTPLPHTMSDNLT